jgi:hypothetical protein
VANVTTITEVMIAVATTLLVVDLVVETEEVETTVVAVTSSKKEDLEEAEATEVVVATSVRTTQIASTEEEVTEEVDVVRVDLLDPMAKIGPSVAVRTTSRVVEVVATIELKLEIKMSPSPNASSHLARTWSPLTSRAATSTTVTPETKA